MNKAVIVGYSRSPFTIANKGDLVSIRPEDLLSEVIKVPFREIPANNPLMVE